MGRLWKDRNIRGWDSLNPVSDPGPAPRRPGPLKDHAEGNAAPRGVGSPFRRPFPPLRQIPRPALTAPGAPRVSREAAAGFSREVGAGSPSHGRPRSMAGYRPDPPPPGGGLRNLLRPSFPHPRPALGARAPSPSGVVSPGHRKGPFRPILPGPAAGTQGGRPLGHLPPPGRGRGPGSPLRRTPREALPGGGPGAPMGVPPTGHRRLAGGLAPITFRTVSHGAHGVSPLMANGFPYAPSTMGDPPVRPRACPWSPLGPASLP